MCNCRNNHRVTTVVNTGTAIELSLTDSVNIGENEEFNMICRKTVSALVTTAPIMVTAVINGTAVQVRNVYGQPLLSNVVPWGRTCGKYMIDNSGETPTPYLWLITPRYA